ncbi:bromodomain-containing protein 8 isoform X2 [Anabrus simplex]|uniref:bromodomain-containing protein 8 isoform X2 n=1 Tax=Anabrus simplex TaxID=316456 RepID=UPI0035A29B29
MALGQERLKVKQRVEVDSWSVKEQLCLAAAVLRSGDQNWMTVSRMLRPFGDPSRPPEWYSQKNCAVQYSSLLENVETPKRKKRNEKGESQVETPSESIFRKLTQERLQELSRMMQEKRVEFMKLKDETAQVKNGSADDRLDEMCQQIDEEKKQKEKLAEAHAIWLKEREKLDADRTWKPPVPPAFPHRRKVNRNVARRNSNQSDPSSEADSPLSEPLNVDVINEDTSESQVEPKPSPATPTSPLLTSLLKSPSPAPTSQSSSILHSAITSHRGSSPTITSLLNSAPGIPTSSTSVTVAPPSAVSSSLKNLVSSAISGAGTDHPPVPASSPAAGAPTLSMLLELPPSLPGKPLPELPSTLTPPSTIATVSSVVNEEVCHPQHEELRVRRETGTDEHVEVVEVDVARPKEEPVEVLIEEEEAKELSDEREPTEPDLKSEEKITEAEQSAEQTTVALSSTEDLCDLNSSKVTESSCEKQTEAVEEESKASGEPELDQSITTTTITTTECEQEQEQLEEPIQTEVVVPCEPEVPDLANMEVIILGKSQELDSNAEPDKQDFIEKEQKAEPAIEGKLDSGESDDLKNEAPELEPPVEESPKVTPLEVIAKEVNSEAEVTESKAEDTQMEPEVKNVVEKTSKKKSALSEEEPLLNECKTALTTSSKRDKESIKEDTTMELPTDDAQSTEKDLPTSKNQDMKEMSLKKDVPSKDAISKHSSKKDSSKELSKKDPPSKGSSKKDSSKEANKKDDTCKEKTRKEVPSKEGDRTESTKDIKTKDSSVKEDSHTSKSSSKKDVSSKDKKDGSKKDAKSDSHKKDSRKKEAKSEGHKRDAKEESHKKDDHGSKGDHTSREDGKKENLEKEVQLKESPPSVQDASDLEDTKRKEQKRKASVQDASDSEDTKRKEQKRKASVQDASDSEDNKRKEQKKKASVQDASDSEDTKRKEQTKKASVQDASDSEDTKRKEQKRKEASSKESSKKDTSKKDSKVENRKESFSRSVSREEKKEESKKTVVKVSSKKDTDDIEKVDEAKGKKRPCEEEAKSELPENKRKSCEEDDSSSVPSEIKDEPESQEDIEPDKKDDQDQPKSLEDVKLEDSVGTVDDKMDKVPIARPETPSSTEDDKTNDAEPPRGIGKKRVGASTPLDSVPNSPAASISEEEREYRVWKKSIMLVYGRLATHKYASLFLRPITDDQAPGYSSLVHRPIDLLMIKKNIETGVTRTTIEFQRDVMLMFCNSIMYNKSSHFVHRMASQMQEECLQHIQDFLTAQMLVQSVGETPHRRETRTTEANKHKDVLSTPGSASQDEGDITAGGKRKRVSESEKGSKKRKVEDTKDTSDIRETTKEKT